MATSSINSASTATTQTNSTAKSAQAQAQATNRANAQAILSSLSAGSGVNVANLAQSLVDAEGNPQKTLINAKITKNESRISGLSAVMFMMSELKTKLTALKDRDSFNTVNASNSNTSALTVTASPSASVGAHQVRVDAISQPQTSISTGFAAKTTSLNGGNPFSFTIAQTNKGGVSAGTSTVTGIHTASISGISFGTRPAIDDFSAFSLTVDGQTINLTPSPAGTTLAELAADLQTQLRAKEGTSDLSVTVSNDNTLSITSATDTRVISAASLKSAAASMGTPSSSNTSYAVISDVSFSANPSVTDFRNFSLTVDGRALNLTPAPTTATIEDLAADIQSQLRSLDGSSDLSVTVSNGNRLEISSATATRQLSAPSLSNQTTISLDTGALGGTSSGSAISGISFGTNPSRSDFSAFDVSIGGKSFSIVPTPAQPTLASLAENIQSQLRIIDNSSDINVSIGSDGTLQVSSAGNRTVTGAKLTPKSYSDTPEGVVAAINSSQRGYKAQLVNDGSSRPFKIMITGQSGSTETFSLSSTSSTSLSFSSVTSASDAIVNVDGISYTRKSNTVTDIVPGVTMDLKAPTTTAASVMVSRDNTAITTKLSELVVAYNDFNDIIAETTNPKSDLETYGATLVGDNTVRMVRQQVRQVLLGTSSTAGNTIKNLSQLGLSIDQKGVMTLDSAKAEAALNTNYDEVVKMFTGGYNNLGTYSSLPAGVAGDSVKKLNQLLSQEGPLVAKSNTATTQNQKYQADLEKLQTRLDTLLQRYNKQFAAMDSLVGGVNAQKTSLKSTFEGMMAAYTNK